ncbi:MAG: chemotaxis protein CheW [bacterium]|nr:chemotaxis protein CheW [bacterium]
MFNLQDEQLNGALEKKYLLVEISDTLYAFGITMVKEVIPMIEIFSVDSASNILGIIKLRDETIPVCDFRTLFGKEPKKVNKQQKLVVLQLNSVKIAVVADALADIMLFEEQNVSAFPLTDKFIKMSVVNDRSIAFVDFHEFYKYVVSLSNLTQFQANSLIPIEKKSLALIKTRTEIINKKDTYVLSEDAFLNEKFVVFRLNDEIYAFNILYVEEIKKINESEVSSIPCVPDFIRGIINTQGDYISLIDIKSFLNMAIMPMQNKIDVVIINVNRLRIALLVDEIIDIEQLTLTKMVSTPAFEASFIKGEISHKELLINMLDVEKLFSSQNINIENYDIE